MYTTIAGIVIAALVLSVAVLLIRFNLKRRHIIQCARAAADEQLEDIYALLDRVVPGPVTSMVLARTNRRASDGGWLVPVPEFLTPWASRAISVGVEQDVTFTLVESLPMEPVLQGSAYRMVPTPPIDDDDEQATAMMLFQFVSQHEELKPPLAAVCPRYPEELLQYLLCAGVETFELDPMDQVRLGGSPVWVQDEEFPDCDHCKRAMTLILQVPGTLLPGTPIPRGTFYFFGCREHPDQTKTVAQFT